MRFCMITTFYPPYNFGGDGIFIQRLSQLLVRNGHQVDVIHCIDSYNALKKHSQKPEANVGKSGVRIFGLKSGVGILSPLSTMLTGLPFFKIRKIKSIIGASQYDVIHFHNISLIGGPGILKYGSAIKLYSMQEHWLICPTSSLFKFQREPCVKKECLRCQLAYHRPPQLWRYTNILKKAVRHVDAFIAPSGFTLRRHLEAGLDVSMVELPNFVSDYQKVAHPPKTESGFNLNRPYFLFVGRLEKLKGLQTVIPVIKRYEKADLVIAGDGGYFDDLKALAGKCQRIHFLGQIENTKLNDIYQQAIAVIVPTLTYEIFPNVILESSQAKTPVIVRALGSLEEMINKNGNGLAFKNDEELFHALETLQTNVCLRNSLGEAGYRAYCSQWNEHVYLKRYLNLIEQIRIGRSNIEVNNYQRLQPYSTEKMK